MIRNSCVGNKQFCLNKDYVNRTSTSCQFYNKVCIPVDKTTLLKKKLAEIKFYFFFKNLLALKNILSFRFLVPLKYDSGFSEECKITLEESKYAST